MVMKARADVQEDFEITVGWTDSFEEYKLLLQSQNYTAGTIKTTMSVLNKMWDYCVPLGCSSPTQVTHIHMRKYLAEMHGKYAPAYINGHISKLRGFYNFLTEDYMDEWDNPMRKTKFLKNPSKKIIVFNDREVAEMIAVAGKQKNKFHAERDKLMIQIMADCGLRVHELVSLQNADVMKDSIFIRNGKGNKQRLVYLAAPVAKQVVRYVRVRDAYFESKGLQETQMFFRNFRGEPVGNDGVQKMLKRLALRCNIRDEVRVSPHSFRHWFAQSQLKNGISIFTLSKLLGHTSISTTQTYLEGLADEELIASAIKTSPLLNIKS